MNNLNLSEIIKNARFVDNSIENKNSKDLEKYFNFDDEIKMLNKLKTEDDIKRADDIETFILGVILALFSLSTVAGTYFIQNNYNTDVAIPIIPIFLVFLIINCSFWLFICFCGTNIMPVVYRNELDLLYCENVFYTFKKVYYPEEYRNEFKKIFLEYYGKYENQFKKWIHSREINNRELYYKLLNNKNLQYDILKKIKENKEKSIAQKKEDEIKEKIKKETIKNQMSDFFENLEKI